MSKKINAPKNGAFLELFEILGCLIFLLNFANAVLMQSYRQSQFLSNMIKPLLLSFHSLSDL